MTALGVTDLDARPSALLAALEAPRSFMEFGAMLASGGLLALAPRGDRSPVVVLPGFTGSDSSTASLRRILRMLGHDVAGWGLGRNLGPTPGVLAGLQRLLSTVADKHGTPVSLVGMSLGGIFARQLAAARPEQVRRVVTLGSPYRGPAARPLPVPTTSVYSRTDGIVPPNACREPDTSLAQSVGVAGSHSGLAHHPLVVHLVADRLALAPGDASPFRPPPWLRPMYELAPT